MQKRKVTFLYIVYVFKYRDMKIDFVHSASLYLLQVTHHNGCMISIKFLYQISTNESVTENS